MLKNSISYSSHFVQLKIKLNLLVHIYYFESSKNQCIVQQMQFVHIEFYSFDHVKLHFMTNICARYNKYINRISVCYHLSFIAAKNKNEKLLVCISYVPDFRPSDFASWGSFFLIPFFLAYAHSIFVDVKRCFYTTYIFFRFFLPFLFEIFPDFFFSFCIAREKWIT